MKVSLSSVGLLAAAVSAFHTPQEIAARTKMKLGSAALPHQRRHEPVFEKRQEPIVVTKPRSQFQHLTNATEKFLVNGTGLPDVNFDIGESYAGLMPISADPNETRELFFWFFPTTGNVTDELTIWLNGGPGCSSLEGLFQENGPVVWRTGTFLPVPNEFTWVNLTNMIWVEQPVGTGFSQGTPSARSETDVASQFLGFLEQWITTFGFQNKKIYVTGESYAGQYVPFIVDAMQAQNNTEFFDVRGLLIYDPVLSDDSVQGSAVAFPFVQNHTDLFSLSSSTMETLAGLDVSCGFTTFRENSLVFPPTGPLPPSPSESRQCDLWDTIFDEVLTINPCFDIYQIATYCPVLWDVLGFPGSFDFLPAGASIYFDRADVQDAIHAPHIAEWAECANRNVFVGGDRSPPSGLSVLPGVIDKNERTIIGHGLLDYILIKNGSLIAIQNMTFGGAQGFTEWPSDPFMVPSVGQMGLFRTERKLTFVDVEQSGHMVPQFQPAAAFQHISFLLGRIPTLG